MGRRKLSIEPVCKHIHFTWGERLTLQYYATGTNKYQKITSPSLLGRLLGKHERTIRRELKRGMVLHELGEVPFAQWDYNADYAQNDAERRSGDKGPDLKLFPRGQHFDHLIRDLVFLEEHPENHCPCASDNPYSLLLPACRMWLHPNDSI